MPKRRIVAVSADEAWNNFLIEAFEDTASEVELVKTNQEASSMLRKGVPDVLFVHQKLLTKPLLAMLGTLRISRPDLRAFGLGSNPLQETAGSLFRFDFSFDGTLPSLSEFQKKLAPHLPVPEPIRLAVVDDEPDVREILRDYFAHRTHPAFEVRTAANGEEGEKVIYEFSPHVVILDIKMPEKDGRELYRDLKKKGRLPPTIVFFDVVSSDEVAEIKKWGRPAFVEKGSQSSGMQEMSALVKKLAYFG